ncbi:hypothetical protein ACF0H5_018154 [Mactra antiquata]
MLRKLLQQGNDSDTCSGCETYSAPAVAGISSAMIILGILLGILLSAYFLGKFPNCYRTLLRCINPSAEASDVLVVGDYSSNGRTRTSVDPYTEINENNTRNIVGPQGSNLDAVTFSRRQGYDQCNIVKPQQKYSIIDGPSGCQSQNSYEPVSVRREELNENFSRTSCPVYHILEPGSNKRLPVRPLQFDMLEEGHIYFKLEPGSNRAVQIPKTVINVHYGSRDFTMDNIYVLAADKISECEAEPYAVNDINEGPMYYTLEKTD